VSAVQRLVRHRFAALVAAASVAALGLASGAVAYWTGAGSGTATATAATVTQPLTLSPATPDAQLYPGGLASVALTATNPNPVNLRIASLSLDTGQGTGGFAVDGSHPGCGLGALSFTTQNNGGNGWVVPRRVGAVNGELSITLSNSLAMAATAANACQGATFTVYLIAGL